MGAGEGFPDGLREREFGVLTLHRPSNVDHRPVLASLVETISEVARSLPIVFAIHPRTRQRLDEFGLLSGIQNHPGMRLVPPMGYLPFVGLVARSRRVLTDSGGIQEETAFLGVPCLTLRENTERAITCEMGSNRLVGTAPAAIKNAAFSILNGHAQPVAIPEKWDGRSGRRIAAAILAN